MALYKLRREGGVYKTDTLPHAVITTMDYTAWTAYQDWLRAGNMPDPMDPLAPEYPTLLAQRAEALARLRALATDKIAVGVVLYDGHAYALDRDWLLLLSVLSGGGPTRQVPDAAGALVSMNPAQFNGLQAAVSSRVSLAVSRFAALVSQINASPAPLTVDITTGWPA